MNSIFKEIVKNNIEFFANNLCILLIDKEYNIPFYNYDYKAQQKYGFKINTNFLDYFEEEYKNILKVYFDGLDDNNRKIKISTSTGKYIKLCSYFSMNYYIIIIEDSTKIKQANELLETFFYFDKPIDLYSEFNFKIIENNEKFGFIIEPSKPLMVLLGIEEEEDLIIRTYKFFDYFSSPELKENIQQYLSDEYNYNNLEFNIDIENEVYKFKLSKLIKQDILIYGTIENITKEEKIKKQLLQINRLSTISNSVAHISHELKTPLNVILNIVELLEIYMSAEEVNKKIIFEKFSKIKNEIQKMNKLIITMRDFSQGTHNQNISLYKPELFPVNNIFNDLKNIFKKYIDMEEIELIIPMDKGIFIFCDKISLEQIIHNIVSNSIDAFIIKKQKKSVIEIECEIVDEFVEIKIKDNSIGGISPDIIGKIWDSFYTTKENNKTTIGNSGIGLGLCKQLAEKMGGFIEVESNNSGSTFTIKIKK